MKAHICIVVLAFITLLTVLGWAGEDDHKLLQQIIDNEDFVAPINMRIEVSHDSTRWAPLQCLRGRAIDFTIELEPVHQLIAHKRYTCDITRWRFVRFVPSLKISQ